MKSNPVIYVNRDAAQVYVEQVLVPAIVAWASEKEPGQPVGEGTVFEGTYTAWEARDTSYPSQRVGISVRSIPWKGQHRVLDAIYRLTSSGKYIDLRINANLPREIYLNALNTPLSGEKAYRTDEYIPWALYQSMIHELTHVAEPTRPPKKRAYRTGARGDEPETAETVSLRAYYNHPFEVRALMQQTVDQAIRYFNADWMDRAAKVHAKGRDVFNFKVGMALKMTDAKLHVWEHLTPENQNKISKAVYQALEREARRENPAGLHPMSLLAFLRKPNPSAATAEKVITSAATSRPQVPALFKALVESGKIGMGSVVLDVGAGRYNLGKAYLEDHGIVSSPYDPYNRSEEENIRALNVAQSGQVDACMCANVLNVIAYPEHRSHVIWLCANAVRASGATAWFSIHEGDRSGVGRRTGPDSWQENRKAPSYLKEIRQYFTEVQAKRLAGRTVIEASGPRSGA